MLSAPNRRVNMRRALPRGQDHNLSGSRGSTLLLLLILRFGGRSLLDGRGHRARHAQEFLVTDRSRCGLDIYGNRKLAFRIAFECPQCRRNVRVIPAGSDPDMTFAGDDVVGGIETDPAEARKIRLGPGMGRVIAGTIFVWAAMLEVAGDIAGRDAPAPRDRDHDVGEILAHTAAGLKRMLDRRMHLRYADLIIESRVNGAVQAL